MGKRGGLRRLRGQFRTVQSYGDSVSFSGFGGGFGSNIDNYRGRFEFDATAYWELRNFGLGERAKRNETWSQFRLQRALGWPIH